MTDDIRLADVPTLHQPVMVLAFSGWNDAGEAASNGLDRLIAHWDGTLIGEIDPQPYTHFAAVRPAVGLVGGQRVISWPATQLWAVRLPACDVIAITGPEPALQWQRYTRQLVGLAERMQARMAVTLGALLTDVPHTRPVQVIATTSSEQLLERFAIRRPTYEGPTGIVGVLGLALAEAGIPTAALWASVPSYAAQLPAPRSSAALVEHLGRLLGVDVPALFDDDFNAVDARLSRLLDDNDQLVAYIHELEAFVDGNDDAAGGDDIDLGDPPALPGDPDELFAEVERFLRHARSEQATDGPIDLATSGGDIESGSGAADDERDLPEAPE